jgi:YD repeat-containing protein
VTRLAGTADAVTLTRTYEPVFNQVTSTADALGHVTTYAYDTTGNPIVITDPLGLQTTIGYNSAGQPISITNAAGTTRLNFESADLVAVTDPEGNRTSWFVDNVGRRQAMINPLGQRTRYVYDSLNRLTTVVDPRGGTTRFAYDPNGNLVSVTDARGNVTIYTYDSMDRAVRRSHGRPSPPERTLCCVWRAMATMPMAT